MIIQVRKSAIEAISIKTCMYAAIYIIFLKPAIIEDVYFLDLIFNALRFGLSLFFLFEILIDPIGKEKRPILFYTFIFITVLSSTLAHSGNANRVFANFIPAMGVLAWFYLERKALSRILNVFYSLGLFLLVLNFLIILVLPDGIWKRETYISVWLLGQKQDFYSCFVSTAFCGSFVFFKDQKKKSSLIIAFAVMITTAIITKAVGTLLCISTMAFLIGLESIKKKIVAIQSLAFINVAGVIMTVVLAYTYTSLFRFQTFLSGLASTGMSKDVTFLTRTQMWEYAINMFLKHPLYGIGRVTKNMWDQTSGLSFYHTIVHNLYFDILMTGGGIAFGFFLALEVIVFAKLSKSWNVQLSRYMGYCLFAVNILFLTECPYTPMVIMCFGLAYWIPGLCYNEAT